MPYIKNENREKFDELVPVIISLFLLEGDGVRSTAKPGELNYFLSSLIWRLWKSEQSYANGSMLCGVLDDVKHEFRRRKFDKYEDVKIKDNGDI